jgi:acyl-CoA thioester hydrolase
MTVGPDTAILAPDYYRFWIEDHVRFADLDALGHCNSAVYSTFFESVRVALLESVGHPVIGRSTSFAIVRQAIDYRRELGLGATLRIGTRVTKLGRTSVALANAVFEGELCAATAEIVGVVMSLESRRPVEVPADLRAGLTLYL